MSQPLPRQGLTLIASTAIVLAGATFARAAEPISPEGLWFTKNQKSIIRVHACPSQASNYCGTLVWLREPSEADGSPKLDKMNKDPARKSAPILGIDILLHMQADQDHWKGNAYNPEDGKQYDITFKVKTDKAENDVADLRGCVFGFLCRTETFTRAPSVPKGDAAQGDNDGGRKRKKRDAKNAARP